MRPAYPQQAWPITTWWSRYWSDHQAVRPQPWSQEEDPLVKGTPTTCSTWRLIVLLTREKGPAARQILPRKVSPGRSQPTLPSTSPSTTPTTLLLSPDSARFPAEIKDPRCQFPENVLKDKILQLPPQKLLYYLYLLFICIVLYFKGSHWVLILKG